MSNEDLERGHEAHSRWVEGTDSLPGTAQAANQGLHPSLAPKPQSRFLLRPV